jgi:hypothetical protein
MPGFQLTFFAVETRGNFKGRLSSTHIYMEEVYVLLFTLRCDYQGHQPQYYNWDYFTNMYITSVWGKNNYFPSGVSLFIFHFAFVYLGLQKMFHFVIESK